MHKSDRDRSAPSAVMELPVQQNCVVHQRGTEAPVRTRTALAREDRFFRSKGVTCSLLCLPQHLRYLMAMSRDNQEVS